MSLEAILQRLVDAKVEFVIIGGFAAGLYGYPVLTEDIDVCLNFTRENLDRLVTAVGDLRPIHRLAAQKLPFQITDANWAMFKNIYLNTDLGILDCLGEVEGVGHYAEALQSSREMIFDFGGCRLLTVEALIRAKTAAGRPDDMKTVGYLRALKGKQKHG